MIVAAVIALAALGLIFGGALAFASQKFAVEVDPKIEEIRELLAGANCGACGFAGCDKFAEEVVAGHAPVSGCAPAGAEAAKKIAGIMGVEAPDTMERQVAQLKCVGDCDTVKIRHVYDGPRDCRAALMFGGGPIACRFGCVGLGNCVRACPTEAITLGENGLPVIDKDLCIGCSLCVKECPRQVLELVPEQKKHHVSCRNQDKGKQVREVCARGCIACTICVQKCPENAISMVNNVAVIDYKLCTNCGICVEVCPQKTIV